MFTFVALRLRHCFFSHSTFIQDKIKIHIWVDYKICMEVAIKML